MAPVPAILPIQPSSVPAYAALLDASVVIPSGADAVVECSAYPALVSAGLGMDPLKLPSTTRDLLGWRPCHLLVTLPRCDDVSPYFPHATLPLSYRFSIWSSSGVRISEDALYQIGQTAQTADAVNGPAASFYFLGCVSSQDLPQLRCEVVDAAAMVRANANVRFSDIPEEESDCLHLMSDVMMETMAVLNLLSPSTTTFRLPLQLTVIHPPLFGMQPSIDTKAVSCVRCVRPGELALLPPSQCVVHFEIQPLDIVQQMQMCKFAVPKEFQVCVDVVNDLGARVLSDTPLVLMQISRTGVQRLLTSELFPVATQAVAIPAEALTETTHIVLTLTETASARPFAHAFIMLHARTGQLRAAGQYELNAFEGAPPPRIAKSTTTPPATPSNRSDLTGPCKDRYASQPDLPSYITTSRSADVRFVLKLQAFHIINGILGRDITQPLPQQQKEGASQVPRLWFFTFLHLELLKAHAEAEKIPQDTLDVIDDTDIVRHAPQLLHVVRTLYLNWKLHESGSPLKMNKIVAWLTRILAAVAACGIAEVHTAVHEMLDSDGSLPAPLVTAFLERVEKQVVNEATIANARQLLAAAYLISVAMTTLPRYGAGYGSGLALLSLSDWQVRCERTLVAIKTFCGKSAAQSQLSTNVPQMLAVLAASFIISTASREYSSPIALARHADEILKTVFDSTAPLALLASVYEQTTESAVQLGVRLVPTTVKLLTSVLGTMTTDITAGGWKRSTLTQMLLLSRLICPLATSFLKLIRNKKDLHLSAPQLFTLIPVLMSTITVLAESPQKDILLAGQLQGMPVLLAAILELTSKPDILEELNRAWSTPATRRQNLERFCNTLTVLLHPSASAIVQEAQVSLCQWFQPFIVTCVSRLLPELQPADDPLNVSVRANVMFILVRCLAVCPPQLGAGDADIGLSFVCCLHLLAVSAGTCSAPLARQLAQTLTALCCGKHEKSVTILLVQCLLAILVSDCATSGSPFASLAGIFDAFDEYEQGKQKHQTFDSPQMNWLNCITRNVLVDEPLQVVQEIEPTLWLVICMRRFIEHTKVQPWRLRVSSSATEAKLLPLVIEQAHVYARAAPALCSYAGSKVAVQHKFIVEYLLQHVAGCARMVSDPEREFRAVLALQALHTTANDYVLVAATQLYNSAFQSVILNRTLLSISVVNDVVKNLMLGHEWFSAVHIAQRTVQALAKSGNEQLEAIQAFLVQSARGLLALETRVAFPHRFFLLTFIGHMWPRDLESKSFAVPALQTRNVEEFVDRLREMFPACAVIPPGVRMPPFTPARGIRVVPLFIERDVQPMQAEANAAGGSADGAGAAEKSAAKQDNDDEDDDGVPTLQLPVTATSHVTLGFGMDDVLDAWAPQVDLQCDDDKALSALSVAGSTSSTVGSATAATSTTLTNAFDGWDILESLLPPSSSTGVALSVAPTAGAQTHPTLMFSHVVQANSSWQSSFVTYEPATDADMATAHDSYGKDFILQFSMDDDDILNVAHTTENEQLPPRESGICRVVYHSQPLPACFTMVPAVQVSRTTLPGPVAFMEWAAVHTQRLSWLCDLVDSAGRHSVADTNLYSELLCAGPQAAQLRAVDAAVPALTPASVTTATPVQQLHIWLRHLRCGITDVLSPDVDGFLSISQARLMISDMQARRQASQNLRYLVAKRRYLRDKKLDPSLVAPVPASMKQVAEIHLEPLMASVDKIWNTVGHAVALHGKMALIDEEAAQRHPEVEHLWLQQMPLQ
eukprot:TRINITY_DN9408_c0_g1_i1.p1 TRINITY_DN9408_c0_g1~~TRINITY_DN9408_c0_g1_i1.p1  ORF type:complete len:1916 (-),score=412.98 TRINITY_DN9408_c0_g1_i1:66-5282(-)